MKNLTIAIVTWNREIQLTKAIESCFSCVLPPETSFVIIDNNSTDNTEGVVKSLFNHQKYDYIYKKLDENIGCGNGRNLAFQHSKSKYTYFLDDDAYIDEKNKEFFINAIDILDGNSEIMTLTTQIYDLLWKKNRVDIDGPRLDDGLYLCQRFCGGSHFLRNDFWSNQSPYYPNKYGLEEIFPSLRVYDAGYFNVFATNLVIIHNPLINKWVKGSQEEANILKTEIVCKLAMKLVIYPSLFTPVLYMSTFVRCIKSLKLRSLLEVFCDKRIATIKQQNLEIKKIRLNTVVRLYRLFGLSVF